MTKILNTKRLDGVLESVMEIFYFLAIVVGYNIIRMTLVGNFAPEQFFNEFGYILFVTLFILALLFLILAEGVKLYIKHSQIKIYYSLNFKLILVFAISLICIFEIFLTP